MTAIGQPAAPAADLQRGLFFRLKGSDARQTTPWRRPLPHLLRRFLLDRINHMYPPHAPPSRALPPPCRTSRSAFRYYTNKAILWITIKLTVILGSVRWRPCTDPRVRLCYSVPGRTRGSFWHGKKHHDDRKAQA